MNLNQMNQELEANTTLSHYRIVFELGKCIRMSLLSLRNLCVLCVSAVNDLGGAENAEVARRR
jgi:hypothetical protein